MGRSSGVKEVLTKWRGKVPREYIDVVDNYNHKMNFGPLDEFFRKTRKPGMGTISKSMGREAMKASQGSQPSGSQPISKGIWLHRLPLPPQALSQAPKRMSFTIALGCLLSSILRSLKRKTGSNLVEDKIKDKKAAARKVEEEKTEKKKIQETKGEELKAELKTEEEKTVEKRGLREGVKKKTVLAQGAEIAKRSADSPASRSVVSKTSPAQHEVPVHEIMHIETKASDWTVVDVATDAVQAAAGSQTSPQGNDLGFLEKDDSDEDELSQMMKHPRDSVGKQLAEPVSKKTDDEKQQASAGSKNTDEADALMASSNEQVAYSYTNALPL